MRDDDNTLIVDSQNIGNDFVKTYDIIKISSLCLFCQIAAKMLQYLYSASEQSRHTCYSDTN